jgi:hypothetical protein
MAKQVANLVELLEESCLRHAQRELFGVRQQGQWHWTSYAEFKPGRAWHIRRRPGWHHRE